LTTFQRRKLCLFRLHGGRKRSHTVKPCPHCRRKVRLSHKKWDCRTKERLSQKPARQQRQSHFSATVWTGHNGKVCYDCAACVFDSLLVPKIH